MNLINQINDYIIHYHLSKTIGESVILTIRK